MPVGGVRVVRVRTVTDRQTSAVPWDVTVLRLVTFDTGQVGLGQVGTEQVGTAQVGTGQVGIDQVGIGQVGTV